jgi:hypothetical protein
MTTRTVLLGPAAVFASVCLLSAAPGHAAQIDAPGPAAGAERPPEQLVALVTQLERFQSARWEKVETYLAKTLSARFDVDRAGLERALGKPLAGCRVSQEFSYAPAGVVLEHVANQVGGTVTWDDGRVRIVPGKPRSYARFLAPPADATNRKLAELATFDQDFAKIPLREVCSYLCDRFDILILIDDGVFREAGRAKPVGDSDVKLSKGMRPVLDVLRDMARQVGADVRVFNECILITPPDQGSS